VETRLLSHVVRPDTGGKADDPRKLVRPGPRIAWGEQHLLRHARPDRSAV